MRVAQHLPAHGARGYSLIEVIVAMAVIGVLARTAITSFNPKSMQLETAQLQVIAQLRLARMSAISQDTHYSVTLTTANEIKVFAMTYDGTTWQAKSTPAKTITLPSATSFKTSSAGSTFEFNSRGITIGLNAVKQIDLTDVFNATKSLQVWPSGQINEL
jgi:prepilin-type N-terminal cleavage/methylation domain-containing protein